MEQNNLEDKYYTPNISEFYVGFEYEMNTGIICAVLEKRPKPTWEKITFGTEVIKDVYPFLELLIGEKEIRVKCLDEEDIEDLGFGKIKYNGTTCYAKGYYRLYWFSDSNTVSIECTLNSINPQIFRGMIKNKSELKKLLVQLGIK